MFCIKCGTKLEIWEGPIPIEIDGNLESYIGKLGYLCPNCNIHWPFDQHTDFSQNLFTSIQKLEKLTEEMKQKLVDLEKRISDLTQT